MTMIRKFLTSMQQASKQTIQKQTDIEVDAKTLQQKKGKKNPPVLRKKYMKNSPKMTPLQKKQKYKAETLAEKKKKKKRLNICQPTNESNPSQPI